jgi:hypothetical protein
MRAKGVTIAAIGRPVASLTSSEWIGMNEGKC